MIVERLLIIIFIKPLSYFKLKGGSWPSVWENFNLNIPNFQISIIFFYFFYHYTFSTSWEKSFPSTSDKPVSKLVTPAGNSSALSTESNLTVKCPLIRPSEVVMMLSTPSSLKLEPESTSQEPCSSIWNQLSSMRWELEPTDNYSTLNNSSQERKMPLTTLPEDITPLVRKSSISASTESENLPTNAQDSKVSSYSTPSVVVLDQD